MEVNNRFDFSTELDIHAFTKEGIDGLGHDDTARRKSLLFVMQC